jgi:DNA mismatch endonuclease (patch repair protein)
MERVLRDTLASGKFESVSPTQSKRMRAVKSRGNKTTERRLRLALVSAGIRGWQVHPSGVTGNPDFYFPRRNLVVFVDGCFWHACKKCGHIPSVNSSYWSTKLKRNYQRDLKKNRALKRQGLNVLRFWEHELQTDVTKCVRTISKMISESKATVRKDSLNG